MRITAMNHGLWASRCLPTHHTLGTDSGDLMLVVTYSGPLPAPPKASTVPRGSCPHPTPARVCVLAPPPLTQQDRQRFWAETLAEAHYMDALGMMGEVNALHVCREAEL